MIFAPFFWVVLIAGLVGCCVGFKRFIWFMSVGYGLAMSCIALSIAVMSIVTGNFSVPYLLLLAVIFAYGLRLGLFLLIRELKNKAYQKTLAAAKGNVDKTPIYVKISMWLMSAVLYFMQTAPLFYRMADGAANRIGDAALWIGFAISLTGFLTEAVADKQKSDQKKANPTMVATKGLFRICRCPNYFGEILVWTGVMVSGIAVLSVGQWIISAIGYVCIVYIMFNGAKRLELRQTKRCWKNPEYIKYVDSTPILIPLVPYYHMITWIR